MPRVLSSAALDYAGPIVWGAKITLADGTVKYYAGDKLTFLGNAYEPYLRVAGSPTVRRSLLVDSAQLEFLNADLTISTLIQTQSADGGFEGAECILSQLLLGVDEAVEVMRGRLHEQEELEDAVRFRLVSDLDPAQRRGVSRDYQAFCTWRFAKPPCGYDAATLSFTERLAERTADIFSLTTIGDSTLAMTVDEHATFDRWVILTAGTGKGQKRLIKSNTATTLTILGRFAVKPDSTSKFKVFTLTLGAPKVLFGAAGTLQTTATSGGARFIERTGLTMVTDEHKGELVRIASGTGSGQQRKIGSNTAVRITIDADEPDFSPAPDSTSVFRVLFNSCPKAYSPDCEERARNFSFNGYPTLTRELRQAFQSFEIPAAAGGGGGVGGGMEP